MRTHYRNGSPITLVHTGCDSCSPSLINGVLCHETGCENSWRDTLIECKWCGREFIPEERGQQFCDEVCIEDYYG